MQTPPSETPPAHRGRSLWKQLLIKAARTLALLAVCLVLMIVLFENYFIYAPAKYPQGDWDAPARGDQPIEEVTFQAADGVALHGWFAPGKSAAITILYFHGNAGNISQRYGWVCALAGLPADVFIIDYRGYGKSEGSPGEAGIYRDAEAAYRYLTERRGVAAESLVIYGKSLGGGPACELASRLPCRALILQSTFTRMPDMARVVLPIFPAHWFMRTRFDNLERIARIGVPKLIVHGTDDDLVPHWMAEKLYEAAAEPKRLELFAGAGHNDLVWRRQSELLETFREFLRQNP